MLMNRVQLRNNTWYFRARIPAPLQYLAPVKYFFRSLHTGNRKEALAKSLSHSYISSKKSSSIFLIFIISLFLQPTPYLINNLVNCSPSIKTIFLVDLCIVFLASLVKSEVVINTPLIALHISRAPIKFLKSPDVTVWLSE